MKNKFQLNAGTGMVMGVVIASIIATIVNVTTGNGFIWAWAILVGIAIGVGASNKTNKK